MALRAPSLEDLKAGFVYERLDPISGEPTYATLQRLFTQLIRNATSVSSRLGGGQFGLSGLAEDPAVYLLCTGYIFNRPGYPGEQPLYPQGSTPAIQATILATWTANTIDVLTVQRTEALLLMLLGKAIEDAYLTCIHNEAHGFGNRTLQDVQRWLFQTYGHIGPTDQMNNTAKLTQPIDPTAPHCTPFQANRRMPTVCRRCWLSVHTATDCRGRQSPNRPNREIRNDIQRMAGTAGPRQNMCGIETTFYPGVQHTKRHASDHTTGRLSRKFSGHQRN